jgi:putative hemolysin
MNKKINTKIAVGVIVLVLLVAGWLAYWQVSRLIVSQDRIHNLQNNYQANNQKNTLLDVPADKSEIANPASVYCEKQGGKLEIRTAPNGGQTGYCIFANGSTCEEWKYYRGECFPSNVNQNSQTKKTTLKKISQGERYASYEGSITVSGRYEEYNPETMLGGILCFVADKKTGYLIPREPDFWAPGEPDTRNPWFCFSDQAEAKKLFGINDKVIFQDKTVECVNGPATVTVSHYITDKLESETYDKAQLDKIISFKKYSTTACGQ